MSELEPQPDTDMTARLVEQLTQTNERLERLESTLRERSLLSGIRKGPEHEEEPAAPVDSRQPHGHAANGAKSDPDGDLAREAESYFRRGVAHCQQGEYDEALAAWNQVLLLQPSNPYALANTGIVFTEQGRWDEAREMFTRVLRIQPDNPEAHYGLGMADAQLGDYAGAIAAWEATLRLQPNNSDARYNLSLVRERLAQNGGPASGAGGDLAREERGGPAAHSRLAAKNHRDREGDLRDFDTEAEDNGAGSRRDWKRVDGAAVGAGALQRSGAGRLVRPAATPRGRSPLSVLAAIGAIVVVGAIGYNFGVLRLRNGGAPHPAPAVSSALPAPPKPAGSASAVPPADSSASPTPNTDANAGGPVPTVHTETVTDMEPAALGGQDAGAARPGRMQLRLVSGTRGRYKYWFVSRSNRAAAMRALPAGSAAGVVTIQVPAEYNQPGAQLRILDVRQGKVARIPVVDASRSRTVTMPNVGPNLLQNADFSQGAKGWSLETTAPGRGAMRVSDALGTPPGVKGRAIHFDVQAIGRDGWNVQCYQSGVDLQDGRGYLLSLWARSDRKRPLHLDIIMDKPNWRRVGVTTTVSLTPQWRKYLLPFTSDKPEPAHSRVSVILGEALGPVELCAISLRPSQGGARSTIEKPNAVIAVPASDFN
jgi:tetratricopeptide (TPR) repeat protein